MEKLCNIIKNHEQHTHEQYVEFKEGNLWLIYGTGNTMDLLIEIIDKDDSCKNKKMCNELGHSGIRQNIDYYKKEGVISISQSEYVKMLNKFAKLVGWENFGDQMIIKKLKFFIKIL